MENSDKKKHLTDIGRGYYISKADPQYWRKMLHFKPDDGESLFYVGLNYEEEANRNLMQYQLKKQSVYLTAYRTNMEKALNYTRRAAKNGYVKARADSIRIENTLNRISSSTNPSDRIKPGVSKGIIALHVIMSVLLLGGCLFFLLQSKGNILAKTAIITNNFSTFIPYEVKHEIPSLQPQANFNEERIYIDPLRALSLVDALVNKMNELHKQNPLTPIKVRAIDPESGSEKGIAVWNGPDSTVKVFIYPQASVNPLLNESITVLRSALYQFVNKNGYFPDKLEKLTKPFPDNYLSSIPKNPQTSVNQEIINKDEIGGWVYQPKDLESSPNNLKWLTEKTLIPNAKDLSTIPFEPLEIEINKTTNRLILKSGKTLFRSYSVALGKDGITPEGEFTVKKKIANPNSGIAESVFGTRALELSESSYAIHGTNEPSSIGKNISHGCIRLNNQDMEELYSLVPLYTRVAIKAKDQGENVRVTEDPRVNPFISDKSNPSEEDYSRVYYWNN
jgi:lipoprotein-anchoring transpeptidase ErfK/SrfK